MWILILKYNSTLCLFTIRNSAKANVSDTYSILLFSPYGEHPAWMTSHRCSVSALWFEPPAPCRGPLARARGGEERAQTWSPSLGHTQQYLSLSVWANQNDLLTLLWENKFVWIYEVYLFIFFGQAGVRLSRAKG